MADIEGFILAGGASSRMGEDKSRLRLGPRTFVEIAAAALAGVSGRVRVVGSRPAAEGHGFEVVRDIYEDSGALGGLHAAFAACEASWAAVVSCDLPFVTPALFERLAALASEEADAVAPRQEDGRPQPLCALYRARACLGVAEGLMREGDLRPRSLLLRVRTRWVAPAELSDLEGRSLFFHNVNTPADYEEAVKVRQESSQHAG
jgi:molybdopterin-guanine dinucleotide biosynthesis protein A